MPHFYSTNRNENDIWFDAIESKHILRTLRKKVGDQIVVTNGSGTKYTCRISSDDQSNMRATIINTELIDRSIPFCTIAVSPLKKMSRWESMIEKLTEFGIPSITPVICSRTEKTNVRKDRIEKIAISALKQSEGFYLPVISDPMPFNLFLESVETPIRLLPSPQAPEEERITNHLKHMAQTTVLIGPEGGFTSQEITMAESKGFHCISLGTKVMRTETAAIYVSSILHNINLW